MSKLNYSPSITDLLVATLASGRNIRRFYAIIREREFKHYKRDSIHVGLSRLHKKGYVRNVSGDWSLTKKGKGFSKNNNLFAYTLSPFKENSEVKTILSFDISESNRVKRNWLRNQLKIFSYKMLQQSLWLGPGPLPNSFLKQLEKLNIRKSIKIFTIIKKNI